YDALELFYSYTSNKTVNKGMFFIEKLNLSFIDGLIYTNEERLKIFTKKTRIERRLQGNIIILHNYPELGLNSADEKEGKNSLYKDKIVFQYNGGVKEDRNLLNILKAFKEIENDKIIFLIIGNHHTSYGDVLKEYVKENGLENMVDFHDFVPLSDLLEILQKTQVGFVPLLKDSLNNLIPEPNKLYNYFATENLAVVEDTPYLKMIVSDENLGLTCDFSNISEIKRNIIWILENQDKVEIIIKRAHQKYLDEYNWNNQEKNLIRLYESINE
ncbi:MAG: glycosyltransferase, partial [Methanobacterium sp.]|nr:glycosyltransferase [Methanobacterium sp.]